MFSTSGHSYIAAAINQELFNLNTYWITKLKEIELLNTNQYISWVSETDITGCTTVYELFNKATSLQFAKDAEKAFSITIIRNDVVRARAVISFKHKDNVPGVGLGTTITGPTDIEYMHEWLKTMKVYIPTLVSKLSAPPADAFKANFETVPTSS